MTVVSHSHLYKLLSIFSLMKKEGRISLKRAKILTLVKEKPMTIREIQRAVGLGRTTVYHHLDHLEKNGLITRKKETKQSGQPVFIYATKKAKPISLKNIERMEKLLEKFKGL